MFNPGFTEYIYIKAESSNAYKEYFGQTAITFKRRFNNHKASFLHINKKNSTTLSHYMWRQRDKGIETNITWEPISITRPYTRGGRDCSLCLTEKATIARGDSYLMLNKRAEVMNKCRHKLPHMLINFLSTIHPQPPAENTNPPTHGEHPPAATIPDQDIHPPYP